MDIIVRYSSQLQLRSDLIPPVLEFFVGSMGIQSNEARVQLRSWYLFERYLVKVQRNIAPMSDQILVAFTDLLQIRITTSSNPPIQAPDSDSDNESEHDVFFDSQLYLFQAAGLLIALMDATKLEVAEALLQSLTANISEKTRLATSDQTLVVNIHHTIMAIGDIAKGYDGADDGSTMARQSVGNRLFAPASEVILEALANFEDSSLIRDAVTPPYSFLEIIRILILLDSIRVCAPRQCYGREYTRKNPSLDRWLIAEKHDLGTDRLSSFSRSIDPQVQGTKLQWSS